MSTIQRIALALVIIGALNWGLIGLFQINFLATCCGNYGFIARIIFIFVGLSGLLNFGLLAVNEKS